MTAQTTLPAELPAVPLTWEDAGERLVGGIMVVEMQHYDARGNFLRHDHVWGQIASADEKNGIRMLVGGRTFNGKLLVLPAALDSFTKPAEGVYRLRSTGEEVENPNWFTTWMITNADQVMAEPAKPPKLGKTVDVKKKA